MEMNKIFAAILTAALLLFGLRELGSAVYASHGGHHGELHLAYEPVDMSAVFAGAGGGEAKKEADLGTLLAAASTSAGERAAALCKSCHTFEQGGANGTGPNLWGVVGRPVGSVSGFSYSSAVQGFGGEWTYERLDAYIQNSQTFMPGTAMNQKIGKDTRRADILAFLSTLSANPVAFPAPAAGGDHPETEEH